MTEQQFNITDAARAYREQIKPNTVGSLSRTDPEIAAIIENFAFDQIPNASDLDDRRRFLCILAGLMGTQARDTFQLMVEGALNFGVDPVEIKEVIYMGVPYLGLGRSIHFIKTANEVFEAKGIDMPLESQQTVSGAERLTAGNNIQAQIYGEGIRESWMVGPQDRRYLNKLIAENCFGDYYTRDGLTVTDREMVAFCFIVAQGGAHPQAISYAIGNLKLGNSKELLYDIMVNLIPYIGYPRVLNGIAAIDNAGAVILEDEQEKRGQSKF